MYKDIYLARIILSLQFVEKAVALHSSTLAWKIPWTEEPGRLQSLGSLRVRHDWATSLSHIGEGNGNPLQCSCLENPRDGGALWAAVYGVAQSWTRLKRFSSSSSSTPILPSGFTEINVIETRNSHIILKQKERKKRVSVNSWIPFTFSIVIILPLIQSCFCNSLCPKPQYIIGSKSNSCCDLFYSIVLIKSVNFLFIYFIIIICFYFILLCNAVLVLPYIDMNSPWVYMRSQTWTPHPPPFP